MSEEKNKKRIAVYGGSFNPPHICHQITVLYLLESGLCDEVWLVPVYRHAFGKPGAPYDVRHALCRALIEPFGERARVSGIEKELGGDSRTVDTLAELARRHPDCRFKLVLGSDIRTETARWKQFERIPELAEIVWIGRFGREAQPGDALTLPDISSTDIRDRLRQNLPLHGLVPERVLKAWKELGSPSFEG